MDKDLRTVLTIVVACIIIAAFVIVGIVVIAAAACAITYIFEHWLSWCKVNYDLLRTGLVLIGFATPIVVYHTKSSE